MPILIAHRGLIDGPNALRQNSPNTIELARSLGFDVEIDLRFIDGELWLGHDDPEHKVSYEWLQSIDQKDYLDQNHAWIHTKNIAALYELQRRRWEGHVFWHQNDDVVLTSTGYLWTFPGKELTPLSICVMPEWTSALNRATELDVFGFCSDYVQELKAKLQQK